MTIDWGDAPAWTAIGLSLVFSVSAFAVSLRGLKWQRLAAEAAVRSANADEKSAALTELQAEQSQVVDRSRTTEQNIRWTLERQGKHRYVLRNIGMDVATGVTVKRDEIEAVAQQLPQDAAVRPGSSVSFLMAGSMAHSVPNEIWVSWDGNPDPVAIPVPS